MRQRLWLLTIAKRTIEIEYVVPDELLAGLIAGIASEPDVLDFHCAPYVGAAPPELSMEARRSSFLAA
jgi:hypothetical protein